METNEPATRITRVDGVQPPDARLDQNDEDLPPGLVKATPKNVLLSRVLAVPALATTIAFSFTNLMGFRFLVRLNSHVGPHAYVKPP